MMAATTIQLDKSDEFLHKIQQAKMKELWDNKEDEAWVERKKRKFLMD